MNERLIEQFKKLIGGLEELPEGFHYEVWDEGKLLYEVPELTLVVVLCREAPEK